jgi:putative acetyltransferase
MSFAIRPIRPEDIENAKWVIGTVSGEFATDSPNPTASFKERLLAGGHLADLDEVQTRYFDNCGMFYVLTDREHVVGTGAVRRFSDSVCELKRLWLLSPYRGRGLGFEMALQLIEWAKENHYEKMRLDTLESQTAAQKLFRKMGFVPIERYHKGPGEIFMELNLTRFSPKY